MRFKKFDGKCYEYDETAKFTVVLLEVALKEQFVKLFIPLDVVFIFTFIQHHN